MRNDWTFEPGSVLPNLPSQPSATFSDTEVTEWRLREYGSSGSELEPDAEPYPMSPTAVQDYDDDDSGLGLGADRRRKRRRQMEEEMEWNEGLRTWMVRRDAWSGARSRRGVKEMKEKGKGKEKDSVNTVSATAVVATSVAGLEKEEGSGSGSGGANATGPGGASTSAALSDVSSRDAVEGRKGAEVEGEAIAARVETSLTISEKGETNAPQQQHKLPPSQPQDKECDNSTADAEEKRKESTETAITEPDHHDPADENETAAESCSSSGESDHEEPLIPVVPSMIATTNPIRASITPAMYPSIYSKVVVQGLTPTVPINLADVTKAMVQGWKADGQWPPKAANTNIVLQDDASVPKKGPSGPADGAAAGGSTETKRRRSSGVANAMRKMLHFSGHPFHRRGSNNDQRQDGHVAESSR